MDALKEARTGAIRIRRYDSTRSGRVTHADPPGRLAQGERLGAVRRVERDSNRRFLVRRAADMPGSTLEGWRRRR